MTEKSEKISLITGGSAGIGLEIARGLAAAGHRTILAVRSQERGDLAAIDIAKTTRGIKPKVLVVDFSSNWSIRAFVAEFLGKYQALDVLVNNAGTWSTTRRETIDGIEMVWATNQLGYFLTAELLKPALKAGSRARIVNVASELARELDLSDVEFKRRPYKGIWAYSQSKQANRMWTRALARRLALQRITVNSMHPGGVATGLFGKGGGMIAKVAGGVAALFGRTPKQGADTAVWLATSSDVEGQTGGFYVDRKERPCQFANIEEEEKLFALCASMTGIGAV